MKVRTLADAKRRTRRAEGCKLWTQAATDVARRASAHFTFLMFYDDRPG